jgi:hypothetical protein
MDLKEQYEELLKRNRHLEEELKELYAKNGFTKLRSPSESENVMMEIFGTVSHYLALFSYGHKNRPFIKDINRRAEQIEFINRNEVVGKYLDQTPLSRRVKLNELLDHIRITGDAHKLSVSETNEDAEGYYMGFPLSSGNIVITWEPGTQQKITDDLKMQGAIFEKFAEMLPEMIMKLISMAGYGTGIRWA